MELLDYTLKNNDVLTSLGRRSYETACFVLVLQPVSQSELKHDKMHNQVTHTVKYHIHIIKLS